MKPEFSIIVPVFNVEHYIEECLESIYNQSYANYELILIDDGSTDGSGRICDTYQRNHPETRVVHKVNAGLSEARNTGLDLARGKYVLFVDSDDYIAKNALAIFHKAVEYENVDVVASWRNFMLCPDGTSEFYPKEKSNIPQHTISGIEYINKTVRAGIYQGCAPYYLYSNDFIQRYKLRFEKDIYHEDELWSIQGLCCAKKLLVSDTPFYYHRMREGSITHLEDKEKNAKDIIYICEKLDQLLPTGMEYGWVRDRIATLYMSGTFIGGVSLVKQKLIDRYLPIRNAKSLKNRAKALIFMVSPGGYIVIDGKTKRGN